MSDKKASCYKDLMHAEAASTTEITGTAEIAINSWEGWIERDRAEFVVDGCLRCLRRHH